LICSSSSESESEYALVRSIEEEEQEQELNLLDSYTCVDEKKKKNNNNNNNNNNDKEIFEQQQRKNFVILGTLALTCSTNFAAFASTNADALDPTTAKEIANVLGPLFAISEILFIVRIVMTWYPSVPITKLPWIIAYLPTEPLLKPTRSAVPPVGGVDVSPIIWVGMISFFNEILLGKQGLLVLLSNKTMA